MEFGPHFFKESNFCIYNALIPHVSHITYLGVKNDKILTLKINPLKNLKMLKDH